MAWVTIGSTILKDGANNEYGTVSFQYDNTSSGGSRSCRLYFTKSDWPTTLNVNFFDLKVDGYNQGTYTVTLNTTTIWSGFVASGSRTVTWDCRWYNGNKHFSITGTVPSSASAPEDLYIKNISSTWNSVTATVGLSSYGTGTGSKSLSFIVLTQTYVPYLPHRYNNTTSGALTHTGTVNNSSNCSGAGCIDIKGAGNYYTGVYVDNGSVENRLAGPIVYTAPSALQSLTYSQTQNASNITVSITITGGTSSNNNSNTVTTYYRYSTNGGSSYTSWTSAGTGTTWTSKTASFNVPYGANIKIQAKQTYQSKDSAVKEVSFTTSSGTAPSGLTISNISTTYNSITATSKITSWGKGNGPNYMETVATTQPYTQSGLAQRYVRTTSSSQTTTLNNSSASLNGGIDIKGAGNYYVGTFAYNGSQSARVSSGLFYTQPAPLQSVTYTQTQNSTNVAVNLTITGGTSSNNNSNTVTTYYCYSTNGGSTFSSWTSAGTGTAWTAKTATFNCNYGASVVVKAKQTYQSKDSEVKQISFTATNGTAPSAGTVTITGSTWDTVTLSATGVNYGKPDGISGRKMAIGVRIGPTDSSYKRENQVENVTSATTTVTNDSVFPAASALTLKGMLPVYAYLWVWNTVTSSTVDYKTTPYYLPPAPGTLTYTVPQQGVNTSTINYVGNPAQNVTDYVAADLKRTVRYSIDGGAWVYEVNDVATAVDTATNFTITIPASKSAVVEAWMDYKGQTSNVARTTIVNGNQPTHLYGSVNGAAKEIVHLYGSVNGARKKLIKLYAPVNGICKKIFEDLS